MSDDQVIWLAQHPNRARTDPGGALRAAREQAGLSLDDFARTLAMPGIGPDAVRAFEEGHARPPQSVIDAAKRLPQIRRDDPPSAGDSTGDTEDAEDAELAARSLIYHSDAAAALRMAVDLGRNDMRRRDAILKAAYGIAAVGLPSRDWLLSTLERASPRRPRIGMDEIEGMRKIFAAFQEMDVCGNGGERARMALVSYFNDRIAPLLDQHHKPSVHRALFQAASEQTYLAGWMAYEAGRHGLAERYLIQSLRLAQESGDTLLGAHVLAGMSDQATLLGHPQEGLKLAKTGQHGLRREGPCAALADLYTLEARAHATLGHKRACLLAIERAERTFDRIQPDNEPEWARFIDVPYLWGEFTNCARDLHLPDLAETFAHQSITQSARQRRARRGALSTYALATTQLQRGELDTACATGQRAAALASSVRSIRLSEALTDLQRRLAPHRHEPVVAQFNEHVGHLAASLG